MRLLISRDELGLSEVSGALPKAAYPEGSGQGDLDLRSGE